MFRLACLVSITCAIVYGYQQDTTNSADAEREKDAYAIYSLMLAHPQTSHGPDNNERYLIEATTVPAYPREPCVRPPKERETDFREVLVDYERRKSTPRELKPAFSIRKPYVLLSANEASGFVNRSMRPSIGETAPDPRFQGVTDLFRLSDVFFNRSRTLALTAISTWCGSLCGLVLWRVFEKPDTGKWEERPWVGCSTISKTLLTPGASKASFPQRE